jgi:hypothetical protein
VIGAARGAGLRPGFVWGDPAQLGGDGRAYPTGNVVNGARGAEGWSPEQSKTRALAGASSTVRPIS